MFAYAYSLEQIGDEIYRAGRTAIIYNIKNKDSLKQIYDISKNSLLKLFELHYQFNNEKLQQLVNLKEDIRNKTEKLKTDNHTTLFLSHAVRIAEESSNLIQLILMLQLKKQNTK
jgi:Na+/phosphate symporter